ncbi:MAG: hypothetical protein ACKVP3_17050 [Hyphomicrobiaceae bacterium]
MGPCPRGRPASGRFTSSCVIARPMSLRWCRRPWAAVVSDGKMTSVRLTLGGVGTRPWRTPDSEQALIGEAPTDQNFRRADDPSCDARPDHTYGSNFPVSTSLLARHVHPNKRTCVRTRRHEERVPELDIALAAWGCLGYLPRCRL